MNLSDLPEHKRTREWIESEIAHEAEEGVHTYHDCKCGRGACRSSRCVQCWREALKESLNHLNELYVDASEELKVVQADIYILERRPPI